MLDIKELYSENINLPTEITHIVKGNAAKENPNIGAIRSIGLKVGPRIYKVATLLQILNAETKQHHHFVLRIQSFKKESNQYTPQDLKDVALDDKEEQELKLLLLFLEKFKTDIRTNTSEFAIIPESNYHLLSPSSTVLSPQDILENPVSYQELLQTGGADLFVDLIEIVTSLKKKKELLDALERKDFKDLQELNSAIGLSQLKKTLQIWHENNQNKSEEYWQKFFTDYAFVLSQIFNTPVILSQPKAYVGGKIIANSGANLLDFLLKNEVTQNAILLELKTPVTELIGPKYRNTHMVSTELNGATLQVLNYKRSLTQEFAQLRQNGNIGISAAINPKCILLIGNASTELNTKEKQEAFEIYRSSIISLEIVTFDELFRKIENLIKLLESPDPSILVAFNSAAGDDLPF